MVEIERGLRRWCSSHFSVFSRPSLSSMQNHWKILDIRKAVELFPARSSLASLSSCVLIFRPRVILCPTSLHMWKQIWDTEPVFLFHLKVDWIALHLVQKTCNYFDRLRTYEHSRAIPTTFGHKLTVLKMTLFSRWENAHNFSTNGAIDKI